MSLRAEYTSSASYKEGSGWQVDVRHKGKTVGWAIVSHLDGVEPAADRLISAHMERVTRMLEGGPIDPEKAEEHDRLAHKADHDNQCEKDLE